MSIHFSAEPDTIDKIYRIILSVNQLSIYGAVAAICDEYEGQPDNTGKPVEGLNPAPHFHEQMTTLNYV